MVPSGCHSIFSLTEFMQQPSPFMKTSNTLTPGTSPKVRSRYLLSFTIQCLRRYIFLLRLLVRDCNRTPARQISGSISTCMIEIGTKCSMDKLVSLATAFITIRLVMHSGNKSFQPAPTNSTWLIGTLIRFPQLTTPFKFIRVSLISSLLSMDCRAQR